MPSPNEIIMWPGRDRAVISSFRMLLFFSLPRERPTGGVGKQARRRASEVLLLLLALLLFEALFRPLPPPLPPPAVLLLGELAEAAAAPATEELQGEAECRAEYLGS